MGGYGLGDRMSGPITPPLTVTEVDGAPSGRPITTIKVSNGDLTISGSTATIDTSGGGGGIGGSIASTQIAVGQSADNIEGTSKLTADTTTGDLGAEGWIRTEDKFTTVSGTDLTIESGGTDYGSIVISDGTNGNITLTPHGTGVIDLDGVEIDNSAIATGYVLKATSASAAGWAAESGGGGSGTVTSVAVSVPAALSISGSPITTSGTIAITGAGTTSQYIDGTGALQTTTSGTVTSVSGSTPISSSGGATPAISITQSDATTDGYLSSTDWSDFDGKQDAITLTTTGTSGAASLVGSTLNIPQYALTAAPAGSDGNLQYNNAGVVGGLAYVNRVNTGTERGLSLGETGYEGIVTTPSGLDLVLNTNSGTDSGAIVIREGANGQIAITPDGTGTIKLDGVELDNSAIATGYVLKATSTSAAGWAAESGGGGSGGFSDYQYNTTDGFTNAYTFYPIIQMPPWGNLRTSPYTAYANYNSDKPMLVPFISPETGSVDELFFYCSSAASSSCELQVGIYDSDSLGNVDSLLGYVVADMTSSGGKTSNSWLDSTGSSTTAPSLTKGSTYWLVWVRDTADIAYGYYGTYVTYGATAVTKWNGGTYNYGNGACWRFVSEALTLPATISDTDYLPFSSIGPLAAQISFS